jgi:hypothetical protein
MKRNSKKQKGYSNECLNTTKEEDTTNNDDDNDYNSENDINVDITDRYHKTSSSSSSSLLSPLEKKVFIINIIHFV